MMSKPSSVISSANDIDVATTRIIRSNLSAAEKCNNVTTENMTFGFDPWMDDLDRLPFRKHDRSVEEKKRFGLLNKE